MEKAVSEFYARDGRCKPCVLAARRAKHAAHPEIQRAKDRARYATEAERRRDHARAYYADHRTEQMATRRAWYAANVERVAAYGRAYRVTNAHKKAAHKAVEIAVRDGVLIPEGCLFCGSDVVDAHHHDYSQQLNVTWLCRRHHGLAHRVMPAHDETVTPPD